MPTSIASQLTRNLVIYRVHARGVGADGARRLDACRRAFGHVGGGWTTLRVIGPDCVEVAGSFDCSNPRILNKARGVRLENLGRRDVVFESGEKGTSYHAGKLVRVTHMNPVVE